jgi:hypothetical protein
MAQGMSIPLREAPDLVEIGPEARSWALEVHTKVRT